MAVNNNNGTYVRPNDEMLEDPPLLRLGIEEECEVDPSSAIEVMMTPDPDDKKMQQAMIICYHDCYDEHTTCEFLVAAEEEPNQCLASDLFMEYVHVRDYDQHYFTALTLYQLKPVNHYFFWAIMSLVMKAHESASDEEKLSSLELAEEMIEYLVAHGGKIDAHQEVQLYLTILEMQGKLKEALEIVEGPLGKKLHCYIETHRKRVDLLEKLGRWKEANVTIKELLTNNVNDWNLYTEYLNTAFHLIDGENSESYFDSCGRKQPDKIITDCVNFMCKLQEANRQRLFRLHCPYLLQLEFCARMRAREKNAAQDLGNFTKMLSKYFSEFGGKERCLNDLQNYIDTLQPNEVSRFREWNLSIFDFEKSELHKNKLLTVQDISNIHLSWYVGSYEDLSYEAKLQLAANLMGCYHFSVQLNSPKKFPTEIQFNDSLAIMVANLMNDVWIETGLSFYLTDAIIVLEHALTKSPSSFQIKLFLIRLYNRLGISKASHTIYKLLNIEKVQLDSLGYLQCWPLLFTGQYQLASQLYETTMNFFSGYCKSGFSKKYYLQYHSIKSRPVVHCENLIRSLFRCGSFCDILEFVEFHDRLNTSLHNSLVAVENNLLKVFHASSFRKSINAADIQMAAKENIDWSRFVDNRDFSIYWTIDPPHRRISPDVVKTSFEHELHYLQYRTLLLRIMVSLANVANAFNFSHTDSFINLNCNVPNSDDEKNEFLDESHANIDQLRMDIDNTDMDCMDTQHNNINNNTDSDNIQDPRKVLKLLAKELQNFSLGENEKPLTGVCITSPDESRIFAVMKSSYTEFLVCLLHIVTSVSSDDAFVTCINNLTSNCDSMIEDAVIKLEQDMSKLSNLVRTANPEQLEQRHEILASLSLLIEMVCIATFVCAVVQHVIIVQYIHFVKEEEILKENATNAVNMQSEGFAGNQQHTAFINQLFHVTSQSMNKLDRIIVILQDEWKDISIKEDNIRCLLERLELSNSDVSQIIHSVKCKMNESYLGSLTEMRSVLITKTNYMTDITLYRKQLNALLQLNHHFSVIGYKNDVSARP